MVNATIKPAPYREKSMQCNNAISECKMMLASIMPSVSIIDEVNFAKSHQIIWRYRPFFVSLHLCTQSIKSSTRKGDSPTGFLENHGGQGTMWKKH